MPDIAAAPRSRRNPLVLLLGATVLSGGIGYVLQILVPLWLDTPETYVPFAVFWATTFLLVSMISGVQQEISRAVHLRAPNSVADRGSGRTSDEPRAAGDTLVRSSIVFVIIAAVIAILVTAVGGVSLFGAQQWELGGALALACVGYALVAVLSGLFYGAEAYTLAAGTTVLDALLRFGMMLTIALLGLGLVPIAYGVALPFLLTALIIGCIAHRRLRGRLSLDVGARKLVIQASQAMLAALATGVLISGLPTILSFTSGGLGDTALAGIVLALTLTRAPIVIPLLALQSYLVVTYRKLATASWRRALLLSAAVAGLTLVVAMLLWAFGPQLLSAVYGNSFALSGPQLALVVASGGTTAGLAAAAPMLLARGHHSRYLAVWALAAVITVAALMFTRDSVDGTLIAIAAGPLIGWVASFLMAPASEAETSGV